MKRRQPSDPSHPAALPSSASDLVKLVNAAARKHVGEVVWLGYQPKSKNMKSWSAPRVRFGTQLVCVTRTGATLMGQLMNAGSKADHIDMWLLRFCQDHRFSGNRCSYVFPPIGSFGTHASECCPDTGVRKTMWSEDYTAEGTRPCEDKKGNRSKDIYGFTEDGKGHVDWRVSLKDDYFAGLDGVWRTFVNLDTAEGSTSTSNLVSRRRRREKSMLKFRYQVESAAEVTRSKNSLARFLPTPTSPTNCLGFGGAELSAAPWLTFVC